ncbi:hypothetical protein [Ekhidna sp.]
MKSTLIYFYFILFLSTAAFAQNPQSTGSNSPGENEDNYQNQESEGGSIESQYSNLEKRIQMNSEKIEPLYFIEEEVIAYGGGYEKVTRKVKKNIYEAGQILLDSHNAALNNLPNHDLDSRIEVLREINKVQDQLLYFATVKKTRPTEKKLKKLESPSDISIIFFQKVQN